MKNEKMPPLYNLQQRQLYFIKDDANKIVNLIFIACVGLEGAAIGYHHADCHGAMPKKSGKTCYSRRFHLEVGDAIAVVFEGLNLFVLLRVS